MYRLMILILLPKSTLIKKMCERFLSFVIMFSYSKFCGIGICLFLIFCDLSSARSTVTHSSELPKCNSFVFFDIEATGVPHMERTKGNTKITEISLITVSRDEFYKEYKGLPRVLPKLTLLSNPGKKIGYQTSRLTGLNNFILQNENPFDENKAQLIKGFLNQSKPPLCLIAHNGIRFDFPLLKEELLKFKYDVIPKETRCVDSLSAFRKLKTLTVGEQKVKNGAKIKGFKLEDLFLRLFGRDPKFAHRAEIDTLVLIQCCLKLGQPILDWFDENSVAYSDIKPTYHKKRNQTVPD